MLVDLTMHGAHNTLCYGVSFARLNILCSALWLHISS